LFVKFFFGINFFPNGIVMSNDHDSDFLSFLQLGLNGPVLQAVEEAGYEIPTPIQQEMIPLLLAGRDVVGQAQTGTGKTAAFALPLLCRLSLAGRCRGPQILVLAPTRELAIQVAESFAVYGRRLPNFRVLPIFGGQDYAIQLKRLQEGPQVVVGTPGRVMDHIRRGTLQTGEIHSLVLDEADEMLKMGFIDDVEWVLEQLPNRQQTALFSATMPQSIRAIAGKYLADPAEITIRTKTVSAPTINQRYLITGGFAAKIEALRRLLEVESFDGMLVFVRTKLQTMELAEQLVAFGYAAAPLNGDIQQSQRLRTVEQLKGKKIDIVVATDVAARGLDVERISHVVNFDVPFDAEAYIHRIGRTGRAGRTGAAILFISRREQAMLKAIERATRQKIDEMPLPSVAEINRLRRERFKLRVTAALARDTSFYRELLDEYLRDNPVPAEQVAAALALLVQGDTPLLLPEEREQPRQATLRERRPVERSPRDWSAKELPMQLPPEEGMERFRIELGREHQIKPGNIVGAIANEAEINSKFIGRISIYDHYSTVDLPYGIPEDTLRLLHRTRIGSRTLKLQRIAEGQNFTNPSPGTPRLAAGKPFSARGKGGRKTAAKTFAGQSRA
jgi:ATP-dependent RNA helicase DeaD